MNGRLAVTVLALVMGLYCSNGFTAEEKMGDTMNKVVGEAQGMQMDEAQMQKMKEMTSPGANHKLLEPLVGSWTYTMKWWMSPDATPEESTGTTDNTWIMDGRFVQEMTKGTSMGQPFNGMGIIGYDNMKGEFTNIWVDNMSTGIMTSSSKYDAAAKTFEENGSFPCPLTGEKEKKYRSVTMLIDNDHFNFEMYFTSPEGKEFKSMEIKYTKAK